MFNKGKFTKYTNILKKNNVLNNNYKVISYSLAFNTLIKPNYIKNIGLLINRYNDEYKIKKLAVKQSYMLLTWIGYISKKHTKSFTLPKKIKRMTLTKSPMAHKTFSQEQFEFIFYKIVVPYRIENYNLKLSNRFYALQFLLKCRQYSNKSGIGTNLMYLKKYAFKAYFYESTYFKLR